MSHVKTVKANIAKSPDGHRTSDGRTSLFKRLPHKSPSGNNYIYISYFVLHVLSHFTLRLSFFMLPVQCQVMTAALCSQLGAIWNNQQMTQKRNRANLRDENVNIFDATVLRRHWLDFNNFGCFEKVWTYILHFWYQCRHCNDYDYYYQWLCSLLKKIWKNRKSKNLKNRKFQNLDFFLENFRFVEILKIFIFFDDFFLIDRNFWRQILTNSDIIWSGPLSFVEIDSISLHIIWNV